MELKIHFFQDGVQFFQHDLFERLYLPHCIPLDLCWKSIDHTGMIPFPNSLFGPLVYLSVFMPLPSCICSSLSVFSTNEISYGSREGLLTLKMLPHMLQKYVKSLQQEPKSFILQWVIRFIMQMPWIISSNALNMACWAMTKGKQTYTERDPWLEDGTRPAPTPGPVQAGCISLGSLSGWFTSDALGLSWAKMQRAEGREHLPSSHLLWRNTFFLQTVQGEGGEAAGIVENSVKQLLSAYPKRPELSKVKLRPPFFISKLHETKPSKDDWYTKTRTSWILQLCCHGMNWKQTPSIKETTAKKGRTSNKFCCNFSK